MLTTPPPVVVKSYLVAIVALGITFAVLAAVVQFSKKMFPTTTLSPATGVNPFVAAPLFPILTSPVLSIQTTFPLTASVAVVVFTPLFG